MIERLYFSVGEWLKLDIRMTITQLITTRLLSRKLSNIISEVAVTGIICSSFGVG